MKRIIIIIIGILSCVLMYAIHNSIDGSNVAHGASVVGCVDVEYLFARGSGAEYEASDMWLEFKSRMTKLSKKMNLSYRVTDIVYPAVAVDSPLTNAIGAFISAGKYYEFGKSVRDGVKWTRNYYSNVAHSCPDTRWVLSGYSQGAMVVAEAVKSFLFKNVIYIALFADPQLDLPEGEGFFPDACSGKNLSEYRVYVPYCRTHEGSLKARNPYQYGELDGKYGLWCERDDYICGSTNIIWNVSGHTKYVGKIKQLSSILKRRLYDDYEWVEGTFRREHSAILASNNDDSDEVVALLSSNEYYARIGEEITFDASQSFSTDSEIVKYDFYIDGESVYSSSYYATYLYRFNSAGEHNVRLQVLDGSGRSSEYSAIVHIADDWSHEDTNMPAPNISTQIYDGKITISWSEVSDDAKCLLVRIDSYDLGCIDSAKKSVTLTDVEVDDYNLISVAWVSKDGVVGDSKNIDSSSSNDGVEKGGFHSPSTGVTFAKGIIPSVIVVGCVVLIRKILK